MARELDFDWRRGFVRVRQASEGLVIEAKNTSILLGQREVDIDGLFMGYREYLTDKRGSEKVVYVDFAFPVEGLTGRPRSFVAHTGDYSVGAYGLSYTKVDGVSYYITVYTPPGFLYSHVVLTPEKLAIFTNGRRQVYLVDEGRLKKLILL